MTVWVYVDKRQKAGDKDCIKIFATADDANSWFAEHDPEGAAFEFDVIGAESPRDVTPGGGGAARAAELAAGVIQEKIPANVPAEEKIMRTQELLQGPSGFRDERKDQPR